METNTNEVTLNSAEEFYGKDAITGNEDVHIEEGNNENQITMNTDSGESSLDNVDEETTTNELNADEAHEPDVPPEGSAEELVGEIEKTNATIDALGKDLTEKGVDFNRAVEEYNTKGELSAETVEALQKAGYPKEVVDGFIASRQALEARYVDEVYKVAGGEDNFNAITSWAKDNLSVAEVNAFNRAIDVGDLNTVTLMLEGINAKRVSKYGTRNPAIVGGNATSGSASSQGFATKDDMMKAISDPRYGRDGKYTRETERKILKSGFM